MYFLQHYSYSIFIPNVFSSGVLVDCYHAGELIKDSGMEPVK